MQRAHEVAARFGVFAGHAGHQPKGRFGARKASGHRAVDEFHLLFAQGRKRESDRFHHFGEQRAGRGTRGVEVVFRRGPEFAEVRVQTLDGRADVGKIAKGLEPLRLDAVAADGARQVGDQPRFVGPSSGVPTSWEAPSRESTIHVSLRWTS